MSSRRSRLLFAIFALTALIGSRCVVIYSSGDPECKPRPDHPCEKPKPVSTAVTISTGRFIDAPVEGLGYASGDISGLTGELGEFEYQPGQSVRFFIGDIVLGEAPAGKGIITPMDLVPSADIDAPAVVNIARLLQSLDAVPDDDRITLPARLQVAASRSDSALSAYIESLDFADNTAFANAASQLVGSLTADYPFTVTLVDAPTARARLAEALSAR